MSWSRRRHVLRTPRDWRELPTQRRGNDTRLSPMSVGYFRSNHRAVVVPSLRRRRETERHFETKPNTLNARGSLLRTCLYTQYGWHGVTFRKVINSSTNELSNRFVHQTSFTSSSRALDSPLYKLYSCCRPAAPSTRTHQYASNYNSRLMYRPYTWTVKRSNPQRAVWVQVLYDVTTRITECCAGKQCYFSLLVLLCMFSG